MKKDLFQRMQIHWVEIYEKSGSERNYMVKLLSYSFIHVHGWVPVNLLVPMKQNYPSIYTEYIYQEIALKSII